jgi:hypothetical protein
LDQDPAAQIKRARRRGLGSTPIRRIKIRRPRTHTSDREAAADRRWRGRGSAQQLLVGTTGDLGLGAPFAARITPGRSVRARKLHKGARADTGAVAMAQKAAEQVRRPRLGDVEHRDENKWHLWVPYLAVELRATFTATKEQRTGRLTVAARLRFGGGAARARLGLEAKGGGVVRGGGIK